MKELLDFVSERHGGIGRWYMASSIAATVRVRGGFWAFKEQPDRLGLESVTADNHRQRITMTPFGHRSSLEVDADLDRVRIIGSRGAVHDELTAPRRSMTGYTGETKWSATQTGCFISNAQNEGHSLCLTQWRMAISAFTAHAEKENTCPPKTPWVTMSSSPSPSRST